MFGNCLTEGQPGYDNGGLLDRVDNWDDIEEPDQPEIYGGGQLLALVARMVG